MKIAVIGATGKAGQLVVKEALSRGHEVTAVVRNRAKVTTEGVQVLEKEVFDLKTADLQGFDVVVNAFGAPMGQEHLHVTAGKALIDALSGSDTRLIVIGGAGSLYVDEAKTVRLFETPEFPEMFLATAKNQGQNLEDLQKSTGLKWTFISPSAFFDPEGKRTGTYTEGKDHLLVNSKGKSYVSYEDFAIAVVDEVENAQHVKERFTLTSEKE
ncbi:NAD(P)-dependent oxidoreductase [Paenibacillus glycanilyticus]|uniref:NAD(P)-dependent oxidoreductase n=1 Tax=Paenibacillus glycanilyticus TaxID=126569 RepID=UPI00203DCA0C|nr:NAD(P)-dependent oxidoreductase [Paenibacillus glycanilyticus]MCM3631176.1 NAD(P)-dependent oxidoreductase [Paenibacillus glycanilyticus]